MKRHLPLLTIAFLIVGCSTSTSNYHYTANTADPIFEFTADFDGKTIPPIHFSLNTDNPESNKCSNFIEVGYYYPESSIFIFAEANRELSARVPANKYISVKGHYNVGGEGSCYAPIKQFMAEEGKTYLINYKLKNRACSLDIIDKQTLQPVKVKIKGQCSRR